MTRLPAGRLMCFAEFACLTAAAALSQSTASAVHLATPLDEIVTALQRTESAIETLEASYICLSKYNFYKPGSPPPKHGMVEDDAVGMTRRAEVTFAMTRGGHGRVESIIHQTNIRYDGSKVDHDSRDVATHSKKRAPWYSTDTIVDGKVIGGRAHSTQILQSYFASPFEMTVCHQQKPISELLAAGGTAIVDCQVWEGRSTVVVETAPVEVRENYIYRRQYWIDVERGTVVRRLTYAHLGEGKPWGVHLQDQGTEYAEAAPGVWTPGKFETRNYVVDEDGGHSLASREHYAITQWRVNGAIDPARFERDEAPPSSFPWERQ